MRGIAQVFKEVGAVDDYKCLVRALPMMLAHARAMQVTRMMKPTDEQIVQCQKDLRAYAFLKAQLWPDSLTWYDGHCLELLPQQLETYRSLGMNNAQGVEGWQKIAQQILHKGKHFAEVGRIPDWVKAAPDYEVALAEWRATRERESDAEWFYNRVRTPHLSPPCRLLRRLSP